MADVAAKIRQLQKRIHDYTTRLNDYVKRAAAARAKQAQLEKRLRQLDDIRSQASNKVNSYSDHANDAQRKLKSALGNAVKKHAHTAELESQVASDMEPSFSSDSNGWETIANVDREIARVQQELDEAKRAVKSNDSNAATMRTNIKNANTSIRTLQSQAKG